MNVLRGMRINSAGDQCDRVLGLKGRFCQPRPKAWETDDRGGFDPERVVRQGSQPNRPFRPTSPVGENPGLRPGLTETALQAEEGRLAFDVSRGGLVSTPLFIRSLFVRSFVHCVYTHDVILNARPGRGRHGWYSTFRVGAMCLGAKPRGANPRGSSWKNYVAAAMTCSRSSGDASLVPLHLGYLLQPRK